MAKNYSLKEAVRVIAENKSNPEILELGRKYPLLANRIARVAVKAGEEFVDFMNFMPDNLSANKVNQLIRKGLEEIDAEEEAEDVEVDEEVEEEVEVKKPAKKAVPKKAAKAKESAGDTKYDSMNNKQMYELLGKLGKRKDCKAEFGDLSHDSMLSYLKKYGEAGSKIEADEEVEDLDSVEIDEDVEDVKSYDGIKAVDLYKMCKERGIKKAAPKKPAKYYVELLKADDAAKAEEAEAEDEEWDDEEEVEEAPKAKAKAPAKKAVPKAKTKVAPKKAEPEVEDDDEDWDI